MEGHARLGPGHRGVRGVAMGMHDWVHTVCCMYTIDTYAQAKLLFQKWTRTIRYTFSVLTVENWPLPVTQG